MKLRTYLTLLRPRAIGFRLAGAFLVAFALHKLAPGAGARTGAGDFVMFILLGPFLAGRELSRALHGVLHQPFSPLLPNGAASLLRWHLPLLALVAATSASTVRRFDPTLPWLVIASVAFANFCLLLPLEHGGRWLGSRVMMGAMTGLLTVAALNGGVTRAEMLASPWLTVALSLGLAAFCVCTFLSRSRLRVRSRHRLSSFADAFDSRALQHSIRKQVIATNREGRPWRIRLVGRSLVNWIRVVLHESFGFRGGWGRQLVLVFVVTIAAVTGALFVVRFLDPVAQKISFGALLYQTIWTSPPDATEAVQLPMLFTLPLFLLFGLAWATPRKDRLYPLSRERRARLSFLLSTLHVAVQIPLMLMSFAALAWVGARVGGVAFSFDVAPKCFGAIVATIPFLPLLLWTHFRPSARPERAFFAFIAFAACFGIVSAFGVEMRERLLSPSGLLAVAALTALGFFFYRRAVHRFYGRADLLDTGTDRPAFRST